MPVVGAECRLLNVVGVHSNLMVPAAEIELGEEAGTL
uniref:Uncharacterized protein n=1 Tax=Arundo donax TaxID=35708 RepID=A0A0A9C8Y9_ARUDO